METRVGITCLRNMTGSPVQFCEADIPPLKEKLFELIKLTDFSLSSLKNARVLIHPNLVRPNPELIPASSTDPRVILALCDLFRDFNAGKIIVGENPGFGFPAQKAFELAGLLPALARRGIETAFFDTGEWVEVDNPSGKLFRRIRVARPVLEADVFVNVPKWKTHMLTGVSLAIKNLLGIIHDDQRMLFHRNDIIEKIVDIVLVRKPELNVIDGLWAMEGQAPFHGETIRDFGGILAGTDILACDMVAAELMGFEIREIPHLKVAEQRLWTNNPPDIRITGDGYAQLKRFFKRPVLSSAGQFPPVQCIECGVCNGCLSAIRHSMDKLNFEGAISALPAVTIVSGRPMPNRQTLETWDGHLILFGNCAMEFQFYSAMQRIKGILVPGCPPHVLDLERVLRNLPNER